MRPLLVLEKLPARRSWARHLTTPDPGEAWDFLARAVAASLYHRSEPATDCRWVRVAFQAQTGGIKFHLEQAELRDEILGYPANGNPGQVRSIVRSMEQAIDALHDLGNRAWPEQFWDECMRKTRCLRNEHAARPSPVERRVAARKLVDGMVELIEHWRDTARTTGIDARHDGVFGLALYAMQLFMECCGGVVRGASLGRIGLRAIFECYVHLAFLLKQDTADQWLSFRRYGAEQAKLAYMHLEELGEERCYVARDVLERLANEDQWQDLLPVNIGHWAKANSRTLAERAGIKADYDRFYSWTSTFAHGSWAAARVTMYEQCVNPLHRLHQAPRVPATCHGDVVPDAVYLMEKVLNLVNQAYPGLRVDLDIWEDGPSEDESGSGAAPSNDGVGHESEVSVVSDSQKEGEMSVTPNPSGALLSPVAMLSMAERFLSAAAQLQGGQHVVAESAPVTHYLYGHALELALKAFLVGKGWTGAQLRNKLGHDLDACLSKAQAAGLSSHVQLSPDEDAAVKLLNESYETKDLEYAGETTPGGSLMQLPSTGVLEPLVSKLVLGLRPVALDALKRMRGEAS